MPKPGELTFVAPRGAKKPPLHLADLTPAERKDAVAETGEKPFRAKQLSQHYFAGYSHDPAEWTDIPVASAREAAFGAVSRADERAAAHRCETTPPARRSGNCTTARLSSRC